MKDNGMGALIRVAIEKTTFYIHGLAPSKPG